MKENKQILISELGSVTGGIVAGILLASITTQLEQIPGLLILLPGFLAMRGNINSTLSARLGTKLHLGTIKPELKKNKKLNKEIMITLLKSLIVSTTVCLGAILINYFLTQQINYGLFLVGIVAGIISTIISVPLTITSEFTVFKKGYDPDDIMGPVISTIGDVVSLFSIIIGVMIL